MNIDLKHEFPLKSDLVYLNHAAVGVWPRRTADAVKAFAEENLTQGAADYPRWMAVGEADQGTVEVSAERRIRR
jgi:selenocysteine lyase/cysteine desulfurase